MCDALVSAARFLEVRLEMQPGAAWVKLGAAVVGDK